MDLAAGIDESGLGSNSIFSLFSISIHVTDEGFGYLKEVGTLEWKRFGEYHI